MKTKLITTIMIILFLASITTIGVVAAYPTGYSLEQTGTGFAEPSSEQWYSFNRAVKMGTVTTADRGAIVFNGGPALGTISGLSYWTYTVQAGTFDQLTAWVAIYLHTQSGKTYADWVSDYLGGSPDVFYIQAEPYYAKSANPQLNTWEKWDAFDSTYPLKWVGLESPDYPHSAPPLAAYISGNAMSWPVPGHGNQAFASREYGSLYVCAIKIRMGYGGPWVNTLAYVDDVTINDYFENFGISPQQAKLDAIAELEAAKTGDPKIDKKIDEIIKHIEKSLEDKLWVDDTHLDPKHGNKVFDEEKEAVQKIQELLKHKNLPDNVRVALENVIGKLVAADKMLAETALNDAKAIPDPDKKIIHEIGKSEKELLEAAKALAKGEPDNAIDHYRQAWEHAQHALEHTP